MKTPNDLRSCWTLKRAVPFPVIYLFLFQASLLVPITSSTTYLWNIKSEKCGDNVMTSCDLPLLTLTKASEKYHFSKSYWKQKGIIILDLAFKKVLLQHWATESLLLKIFCLWYLFLLMGITVERYFCGNDICSFIY